MKRIAPLFAVVFAFAALFLFVHQSGAAAGFHDIDDFESYSTDGDLQTDPWTVYAFPAPTLLTSGGADGGQAMSLYAVASASLLGPAAPLAVGPAATEVVRDLPGENLSDAAVFTVWYRAGAQAVSGDKLDITLGLSTGAFALPEISVYGTNAWTRRDFDVSGLDLSAVSYLDFSVFPSLSRGAQLDSRLVAAADEVVQIDAISFNNGAVWLGDANSGPGLAPWETFGAWESGPPSGDTTAVIPTAPVYTNWPVLSASHSVANLTVETGAELILGTYNLTVFQHLVNHGRIEQTRDIAALGTTYEYLHTGGYHGADISAPDCCALADKSTQAAANGSPVGAGPVTVAVSGANCVGDSSGVSRCFEITPASPPPNGLNITFYVAGGELNGLNCDSINVYHYNSGSAAWELLPVSSRQCALDPYSVTVNGVTSFSPFGLGVSSPTAVSLTHFRAAPGGPWSWLRAFLR